MENNFYLDIEDANFVAASISGVKQLYNMAAAMGWRLLRATPQTLLTAKFLNVLKLAINNS